MRARWSPTGSRSMARALPASPGTRRSRRAASSPGCSIRPSCCRAPNCPSTAPSCKSLAVQIRYPALDGAGDAGRQGEAARPHRARLCRAVAAGPALGAAQPRPGNLPNEIERQILPDGGHISRNPMAVLELLADLLPLRQTYANQAEEPPARADRRGRAHAAGAALLPPSGRQPGPLQRHGRDHP